MHTSFLRWLTFGMSLMILFYLFDYHEIIFLKPQGSHIWRQTDCASIALNYYRDGMDFFKPRVHNHYMGSGYGILEFPIIYYLSALCYKAFGFDEFWYRLVQLSFFLAGLIGLYKICMHFIRDHWVSLGVVCLFFSFPIVNYYANNFTPDIPALSLSFAGIAAVLAHSRSRSVWSWLLACIAFTLCGTLKVTALIGFVGIMSVMAVQWFSGNRFISGKLWMSPLAGVGMFLICSILIFSWYQWTFAYNTAHGTQYFLTDTEGIWKNIDLKLWWATLQRTVFWSKLYFFPLTGALILPAFLSIVFLMRVPVKQVYALLCLFGIGSLMYYLMWFNQFKDHDYYVTPAYHFIIILPIAFIDLWKTRASIKFEPFLLAIFAIAFLGLNIWWGDKMIHERYHGKYHEHPNLVFYDPGLPDFLIENGINENDKVISLPDYTPNVSIYLLNRQGWTNMYMRYFGAWQMNDLISSGAAYLLINDSNYLKKEFLADYLIHPVDTFRDALFVYDLRNIELKK